MTSAPDRPEKSCFCFCFQQQIEISMVTFGSQALNVVLLYCQVIQFGADCNQDECTCRDPDAEENKSKAKALLGGGGAEGGMQ